MGTEDLYERLEETEQIKGQQGLCVSSGKVTPLLQKTFENMAKMSKILSNYPTSFRLENRQA